MPTFQYEAIDIFGRRVRSEIDAPNRERVARALQSEQMTVVAIWPKLTGGRLHFLFRWGHEMGIFGVKLRDLAIFTRQLSMMLDSGIHIVKGLECLAIQRWENRTLSDVSREMANSLREGARLSAAMAEFPRAFNPVYVSLVQMGEQAGSLSDVLRRTADYQERDYRFRQQLMSALAYPAMIFLASAGLLLFLTTNVFPTFISFFRGLSFQLPWITSQLYTLTLMLADPFTIGLFLVFFTVLGLQGWRFFSGPRGGYWRDLFVLRIPVIARLFRYAVAARFCRGAALLLECGLGQLEALDLLSKIVGSPLVERQIKQMRARIRDEGSSLSLELQKADFFPPFCGHLVKVGEEAGRLPEIFQRLSECLEQEVEELTTRALAMLEPLMLGMMGLVVGFVLLTVFLPIYKLVEAL